MKLPSPGEVHLWHLDHRAGITNKEWLSSAECDRAARYRFPKDQTRYCFTQSRKREILASYLNEAPGNLQFTREIHGKPRVAGLEFSLSHSEGLSLLAVSASGPIGIDLESLASKTWDNDIAERILAPSERLAVGQLPDQAIPRALLRIWTAKEAYLKALGTGLTVEPHLVESHFPTLSHAVTKGRPPLQLQELPLDHAVAHLATESEVTLIRQE